MTVGTFACLPANDAGAVCYNGLKENAVRGGDKMSAVRARYENGVLTPLEPLDLAEGAEVMVSVEDAPLTGRTLEALRASAGGWGGGRDPEELKRMICEARITGSREPVEP